MFSLYPWSWPPWRPFGNQARHVPTSDDLSTRRRPEPMATISQIYDARIESTRRKEFRLCESTVEDLTLLTIVRTYRNRESFLRFFEMQQSL